MEKLSRTKDVGKQRMVLLSRRGCVSEEAKEDSGRSCVKGEEPQQGQQIMVHVRLKESLYYQSTEMELEVDVVRSFALPASVCDAATGRDLAGRRVRHATAENNMREWNEEENRRQRELEKVALEHIKKEGAAKRAAEQKKMLEKEAESLTKLGTEAREITATAVTVGLGTSSSRNSKAAKKAEAVGYEGNGKSKVEEDEDEDNDDDEDDDDDDDELTFEFFSSMKPEKPTGNGDAEPSRVVLKKDFQETLVKGNSPRSESSFEEQPTPKRVRLNESEEEQSSEETSEVSIYLIKLKRDTELIGCYGCLRGLNTCVCAHF